MISVIVPNELVRGHQERYSLSIKNDIKMSTESFNFEDRLDFGFSRTCEKIRDIFEFSRTSQNFEDIPKKFPNLGGVS